MPKDFDDEVASLLKTVADHFDKEDRMTRERQIRHYRRLKLYWANFSQIYWSEVAHDYRIYNRSLSAAEVAQERAADKPGPVEITEADIRDIHIDQLTHRLAQRFAIRAKRLGEDPPPMEWIRSVAVQVVATAETMRGGRLNTIEDILEA